MGGLSIALDVEGVLADSHAYALNHSQLTEDDFSKWGFDTEERKRIFLNTLTKTWHERWEDIPMTHPLNAAGSHLLSKYFNVDIVTARTNADDEIQFWLEEKDISYDNFISTDTYKERLDYDIYIDDNPHMTELDIDLYLVDKSWNRHRNAEKRVRNVIEAATHIIINYE